MVRHGIIITLVALIGALISGLVAFQVYNQEIAINRIAMSRAVDIHASIVQDRLTERELLARVASGLFHSPSVLKANMLQPLRVSIEAFQADFVLAAWIARVQPSELPNVTAELRKANFANPVIRHHDDTPIQLPISAPVDILMDMEPRSERSALMPGRIVDRNTPVGAMLARATSEGRSIASDPYRLPGHDGPIGIVIAAPVLQDGQPSPVGFVAFSYTVGSLLLTNDEMSVFSVALADPRDAGKQFVADHEGLVSVRAVVGDVSPSSERKVSFGGRDWTLEYYARSNLMDRAWRLALIVAGIGLGLTAIVSGMFGYAGYNNLRLSREIEVRIGFEQRLTDVIDELNHRVKNVLAVIQSIVTRTLRNGSDINTARELLIGRIHAMSNVVSLLSESQWQGVNIRSLFESGTIPNAERIAISGPDIVVSARAAQSLSLLFYELASHSVEDPLMAGKPPNIIAHWQVTDDGDGNRFQLRWEEFNINVAARRPDSEFGILLLDRAVPEALGGSASRRFTEASYVYELSAPLKTVIDMTERERTDAIGAPIRSRE